MGLIATVEDEMISVAQTTFGNAVRTYDTLPGPLTEQLLKKMIALAPGIFSAFLGTVGKAASEHHFNGRFALYCISQHARGPVAARRGDSTVIGAYDLVEMSLPQLNGHQIAGIGALEFSDIKNMFDISIEFGIGVAMFAVLYDLPNMPLPPAVDEDTLNDFVTYDAVHKLSDDPDVPTSQDIVTLEQ